MPRKQKVKGTREGKGRGRYMKQEINYSKVEIQCFSSPAFNTRYKAFCWSIEEGPSFCSRDTSSICSHYHELSSSNTYKKKLDQDEIVKQGRVVTSPLTKKIPETSRFSSNSYSHIQKPGCQYADTGSAGLNIANDGIPLRASELPLDSLAMATRSLVISILKLQDENCDKPAASACQGSMYTSLNITKMAALCGKDTLGEDKVDSLGDSSLLTNDYKVKEELKPMLQAIFQKNGDIATECSLTTVASLSFLLEIVCEIMQTMQAKDFVTLTVMDINDMFVDVRDL